MTHIDNDKSQTKENEENLTQFLINCSQALWQETTLYNLIQRFASILHDGFHIKQICFANLSQTNEQLTIDPIPLTYKSLVPFPMEEIKDFLDHAKPFFQSFKDLDKGLFKIQLNDESYSGLIVSAKEDKIHICFWIDSLRPKNYLEWFARLFKHECLWLLKLDQTQLLLNIDDLTGLYNYRYLESALNNEIRRALRYNHAFTVMFIDLDQFKSINDHYGHLIGSLVLKQVADVLKNVLREIDSIIRYGGDEFIVILLEANSQQGQIVAERIRYQISKAHFGQDAKPINLSVSIGLASFPEHGNTSHQLLKLADESMYHSKRRGRNRVSVANLVER